MFRKFLLLKAVPIAPNFGLLLLRIVIFLSLFLKHGTEKLLGFGTMSLHFPDPLHIGAFPSFLFAMISDGICTLLIVVGLATRWAAVLLFVNVFVAWAFIHNFLFFGRGSDHGELIVLYLGAAITLFFTGAGRFSIDALLDKQGR